MRPFVFVLSWRGSAGYSVSGRSIGIMSYRVLETRGCCGLGLDGVYGGMSLCGPRTPSSGVKDQSIQVADEGGSSRFYFHMCAGQANDRVVFLAPRYEPLM